MPQTAASPEPSHTTDEGVIGLTTLGRYTMDAGMGPSPDKEG